MSFPSKKKIKYLSYRCSLKKVEQNRYNYVTYNILLKKLDMIYCGKMNKTSSSNKQVSNSLLRDVVDPVVSWLEP